MCILFSMPKCFYSQEDSQKAEVSMCKVSAQPLHAKKLSLMTVSFSVCRVELLWYFALHAMFTS